MNMLLGNWVFNPSALAESASQLLLIYTPIRMWDYPCIVATSEQTGWDDTRGCVLGKHRCLHTHILIRC